MVSTSVDRDVWPLRQPSATVLEAVNIQLGDVATDVLGTSGRASLKALIAGERDVERAALQRHLREDRPIAAEEPVTSVDNAPSGPAFSVLQTLQLRNSLHNLAIEHVYAVSTVRKTVASQREKCRSAKS